MLAVKSTNTNLSENLLENIVWLHGTIVAIF